MKKEKVLGVIPARIGSTRIPEKMLIDLCGKTLVQHTYERSKEARSLDALVVVTDSERIAEHVAGFGADVLMSSPRHKNGTERASEAVQKFTAFTPDIVVTIWGDEPLYPPSAIDRCVAMLQDDPTLQAVTAADRITNESMRDVNSVVKIVTDQYNHALYISRSTIPYHYVADEPVEYYHVIGAMAMRRGFLFEYVGWEQTPLERVESVEQLRILENGYKLGIVKGDFDNLGVNTPEELEAVRAILRKRLGKNG